MYNRYIPQPDGSFRRSRVPDHSSPPKRETPPPEPDKPDHPEIPDQQSSHEESQPEKETRIREPLPCRRPNSRGKQQAFHRQSPQNSKQEPQPEQKGTSVGSFLHQLLPKDFDTGDLLIVLLLLLMSGDCAEDQNSALLTLALYLFM